MWRWRLIEREQDVRLQQDKNVLSGMPFSVFQKGAMLPLRLIAALACALMMSGCATRGVSLQEVREFASASGKLAGFADLSTRFRTTYQRELPYLTPAADQLARENDARRAAVYQDFISAQKTLQLYMQTLGQLAGEDRYDLSPRLDELGDGLRANAETRVEKRHVTAYMGLTRLVTRVLLSNYQARSVQDMVRDGDPHVQALLQAMHALLRYYAKTNENEKKTVLGMFDIEIPFSVQPRDRMLVTLAKVHYTSKLAEYRLIEKRYALAQEGLDKIALGHRKLRENINDLHGAEVRKYLEAIAKDLAMIHEGLKSN